MNNQQIDWDLVLKALGFIVAAVVGYFQIRNLNFAARASLKTDLEILKLLDPQDSNYQIVKVAVDKRVADVYAPPAPRSGAAGAERWGLAIFGLIWALGFAYWTFTLAQPSFSWWSLLTGYLAVAGVGWFLMGISGRSRLGVLRRSGKGEEKPAT